MAAYSPSSDPFPSVEQAAHAAALHARKLFSNKSEAISVVYEKDGQFFYTIPTTKGAASNRNTKAKLVIPPGSLRMLVHNHPQGEGFDTFSSDDLDMANRVNVPSIIVFGSDDNIQFRKYVPGQTATTKVPQGNNRTFETRSKGEEFIWEPESQLKSFDPKTGAVRQVVAQYPVEALPKKLPYPDELRRDIEVAFDISQSRQR